MGRRSALLLSAVLVAYFAIVAQKGVLLLASGSAVGVALGVAVLAFPVLGAVLLAGEIRLGRESERLAGLLDDPEPVDFDTARAGVEADPQRWQAWFRLARAYGEGRDTARGRQALRRAIALQRQETGR